MLKPVLFIPDDDLIYEGERGERVFFIGKGKVKVMIKKDSNIISQQKA
jgi:hypothetical protein